MHNDRFTIQHALQHLPAALQSVYTDGHGTLTVGVTGTDDGHREPFFTISLQEQFLTGNLVT